MRLFFLLLFSNVVLSQTTNSIVQQKRSYNFSDGYNITNPNSAAYDKLGWLWIIGNNYEKSQFQLDENRLIIQRFDGTGFYNINFPETEATITGAHFIKAKDNLYIFIFLENAPARLYKIDCENLTFKEVKEYQELKKVKESFGSYVSNNQLFFVFMDGKEVQLYKLEDRRFTLTDSIKNIDKKFSVVPELISNNQNYTILSLEEKTNYLINKDGKVVKKFKKEDFVHSDKAPWSLNYLFHKNGASYYFNFSLSNTNFFSLNETTQELKKLNPINVFSDNLIYRTLNTKNQVITIEKLPFTYALNVYDISGENFLKLKGVVNVDGFSAVASRNLDKEITILHGNSLEYIQFREASIKTFLKGKSIRAIRELENNNYLVSSDYTGFYKVNIETEKQEKVSFKKNNKEYQILYPRDIIQHKGHYFLNDRDFILEVTKDFKVVKQYKNNTWFEEIVKKGDTLFKGGLNNGGMLKFSLATKEFYKVKNANFMVREFAVHHKKLYATTLNRGLMMYNNGSMKFFVPPNENPENLLSIINDTNYGLLITTKLGKVYSFNTQTKTFKKLYEDNLEASIVGVVSDTTKVLWMNTYAGIVSYNPTTKLKTRYTKKDGIHELEGNRYSTYRDSKGNIFMGSLNGLTVFNPYKLHKNKEDIKLQFSSLSFFNVKENNWQTNLTPNYLTTVKKIELPFYSQGFTAKVTTLNYTNNDYKFRYRLVKQNQENNTVWNRLYLQNQMIFSNLSAGNYTLEIEVLNSLNQKVGESLKLEVISNQVFYKMWWFILLIILIILGIFAYLFYQFKEKQHLFTQNKIALNEAKIKETMMLEIHHRIKNNLQVISGLLSIQAFNSDNEELKVKLKDSQSRIESIAGIHNILYSSDDQEAVYIADYFEKIITYNKTLFPIQVNYKTLIEPIKLSMDKAIPLALILNELINNSHKHAFINQEKPQINITISSHSKLCNFLYSDNGNFKDKKIENTSMGMKIIDMMVTQLKGKYKILENTNFTLEISFPI